MTVKELKECFSEFNLKTKKPYPDDYVVTTNDIENGTVFQKFVDGNSVTKIISGLQIIDDKICYVYPVINKIEILTEDNFPPCGGEQEIYVYAKYGIQYKTELGNYSTYKEGLECTVNAIIKLDNDKFTYGKPYLVNETPNSGDTYISVNITASYYFNGVKLIGEKEVKQLPNTVSNWLIDSDATDGIEIKLSENEVSNKGGIVIAKVNRIYSRVYCKKDSCGNKVDERKDSGLTEDITNRVLITSSNRKAFIVNKNVITVLKQDVGAEERQSTITARYIDKTSSCVLKQHKGGNVTYTYEISFDDGTMNKFVDLETSLPTEKAIGIISKKYKYIDGEYDSVSISNDIQIESDSDWLEGSVITKNDSLYVVARATTINLDKVNDREGMLTIINTNIPDTKIKLVVAQSSLNVVKEEYYCDFYESGEYTYSDLNNKAFYFKPIKILVFEDGEREAVPFTDNFKVKSSYTSDNNRLLNLKSVEKKNDIYAVNFNNDAQDSVNDIKMTIKLSFYDLTGKKVFDSETGNIVVEGTDIVDYRYELCFENHATTMAASWSNSTTPKYIKLNSYVHKMVNGKSSTKEPVKCKIVYLNSKGLEEFDDTFSIKAVGDELLVFPLKTNKDVKKTYYISQIGGCDKIKLNLEYTVKKETFDMPLRVVVYSDNVEGEIWTEKDGYLLIDKKNRIDLNPCWLSPKMKDKVDIAYEGVVAMTEGSHMFETFNVILLGNDGKTRKDCNVYILTHIDKNTKNFEIQIKV